MSRLRKSRQFETIHPWLVQVPISHAARTLYITLLFFARGDEATWPSVLTLKAEMGCSSSSIREYLRELDREGLLERKERRVCPSCREVATVEDGRLCGLCGTPWPLRAPANAGDEPELIGAQMANEYVLWTEVEAPSPKPTRAAIDEEQPPLTPLQNSDRGGSESLTGAPPESWQGPLQNGDTLNNAVVHLRKTTETQGESPKPSCDVGSRISDVGKPEGSPGSDAEDDWLAFVEVYPPRAGPNDHPAAKLLLEKAISRGAGFVNILEGARRYREYADSSGKTGTEFVKSPATWLRDRGWLDEIGNASGDAHATADYWEERLKEGSGG